jgi:hypothetical protein
MVEKQIPNILVEQRKQHLAELDFESVGETGFWAHRDDGGFVLGIDPLSGRYDFFVDYHYSIQPQQVKAIAIGVFSDSDDSPTIQVLQSNPGREMIALGWTPDGSGGNIRGEKNEAAIAMLQELSILPISDQLAKAGFTEDASKSGVWKRRLKDGETKEVTAIVKDGVLLRLISPIDPSVFKYYKFDESTEIISIKEQGMRGEVETLTLQNDLAQLDLHCGGYGGASTTNVKLLRELTTKELDLDHDTSHPDISSSAFVVGGVNSTDVIRELKGLNGRSIIQLETDMRPCRIGGTVSFDGFIGRNDSLIEVLAADNKLVKRLGLTHQDLALPLRYVERIVNLGFDYEFSFRGSQYEVESSSFATPIISPFGDGTGSRTDVDIHNLTNGESMRLNLLLAEMINRYGFYEGNVGHRVEPEDIIKVFPYLNAVAAERLPAGK